MAHPDAPEAVDVPATHTVDSAAAALANSNLFGDETEEPAPEAEDEISDAPEGEDLTDEDIVEEEDEGDEPEDPAIEAPVSLNKAEKEAFASATPEVQRAWAEAESRRNQQVQEATTKASQAQRDAEARAAAADAEAKRAYAAQLSEFTRHFAPQAPDPQLAYTDPQSYVALKAQYDAQKAQYDDIMQQAGAIGAEADESSRKAFIEQRDRELMAIPEIANAETRDEYLQRAFSMAEALGYERNDLIEGMTARDVKALAQTAEWKAKAEKYDAAMARQMQRVRAGKQRTLRPGTPPAQQANRAYADATNRLKQTGKIDDAAAALKALL